MLCSKIIILTILIKSISCASIFNNEDEEINLSHIGSRIFGKPNRKLGAKLKRLPKTKNPEESGTYFEGDLLIPRKNQRNGIFLESYRWTNATIPYEIQGNFCN